MPTLAEHRLPWGPALRRGLRRRCPRCGEGALFQRGIRTHERCPVCGLLYQRDRGDTWLFMIITDRIPLLIGIAAVYFGFHPQTPLAVTAFFGGLALAIFGTIRERQGLALAIDYLVRAWVSDPGDEVRSLP
jgi:uncharacterized protein (DUF983 family)